MVILVTGKADAGKTHYANALADELQMQGKDVVVIDGDEYREEHGNKDFSDAGRMRNLIGASELARQLEDEGKVVVMAFVSPRRAWRTMMRRYWKESRLVYIPGGNLWDETTYEIPTDEELNIWRI